MEYLLTETVAVFGHRLLLITVIFMFSIELFLAFIYYLVIDSEKYCNRNVKLAYGEDNLILIITILVIGSMIGIPVLLII